MSIDSLNVDHVQVLPSDPPEPTQNPGASSAAPPTAAPSDHVALSSSKVPRHAELLTKKEEYLKTAGAIREKDKALETIGQKVGALKEPLQAIVKQYPPFKAEDQTRIRFLKQYAALRREIEALMVPRPDDAPRLPQPPVVPSPLAADATDSQINDHLKDLDAAGAAIDGVRQRVASESAVLASATSLFTVPASVSAPSAALFTTSLGEAAAVGKSAEVGQQFAGTIGQGAMTSNSHFLKSLG